MGVRCFNFKNIYVGTYILLHTKCDILTLYIYFLKNKCFSVVGTLYWFGARKQVAQPSGENNLPDRRLLMLSSTRMWLIHSKGWWERIVQKFSIKNKEKRNSNSLLKLVNSNFWSLPVPSADYLRTKSIIVLNLKT